MMPRLDLTPAPIALPHDLSPNARSQGRYWPRDFRPWLTRKAMAQALTDLSARGEFPRDIAAANGWSAEEYDRRVDEIRRALRNGGAR